MLTSPEISTLYALCKTSKKLLRIAEPCLYTCIRSTSSTNADQLLGTLKQSPTLANRVQSLSVQHSNQTTVRANNAIASGAHITVEHTFLTVFTTRTLPHLTTLDLLHCPTKEDRNPIWSFFFFHPDPKTPTPWSTHPNSTITSPPHLRSLSPPQPPSRPQNPPLPQATHPPNARTRHAPPLTRYPITFSAPRYPGLDRAPPVHWMRSLASFRCPLAQRRARQSIIFVPGDERGGNRDADCGVVVWDGAAEARVGEEYSGCEWGGGVVRRGV